MEEKIKKYKPVIGLEVHVELATKSKMFCGCRADHFGKIPNTQTCPVCLGLPGALPVPNRKATEWTVLLGLALNCKIPAESKFDRKNYFYPDLAKGYQISQYDMPLAINGSLKIKNTDRKSKMIRIRRVHLEEDTGKLIHVTVDGKKATLIDFNRSGAPLVEIVTEPDIESAQEAKLFLQNLQQTVRYLGISDADMEKGSMRLEPNISVKTISPKPSAISKLPNYKVEVKNINSFRFAEKAIKYEIERQIAILEQGETPVQETRGWYEAKQATVPQRLKEEAQDYRYFPEPDIPPMRWEKLQITNLKSQLPELPDMKKERFMGDYQLNDYDAQALTETRKRADYFEQCVKLTRTEDMHEITPKEIANWVINRRVNLEEMLPTQLIRQIKTAREAIEVSKVDLDKVINQIISQNSKAATDYKNGREQALMFLLGQIQRELKGRGKPSETLIRLKELLT